MSRTHGIAGTYQAGCRCDPCRIAQREQTNATRAKLKGREPYQHGATGYSTWGCRCGICRAANTEKTRAYRAARKAAS